MDSHVELGLRLLLLNDSYLLDHDLNERTICHKLAEYYQSIFRGWDVDCEFNKNLDEPKRINIDPSLFLNQMANFLDKKSEAFSVQHDTRFLHEAKVNEKDIDFLRQELRKKENLIYDEEFDVILFVIRLNNGRKIIKSISPDIIVHHRGTMNNFIVFEIKKSTNRNKPARLYDLVKLITLVQSAEYNYKYGYFVDIPTAHNGDALRHHKKFVFGQTKISDWVLTVQSQRSRGSANIGRIPL
jgi:hypothetical protein